MNFISFKILARPVFTALLATIILLCPPSSYSEDAEEESQSVTINGQKVVYSLDTPDELLPVSANEAFSNPPLSTTRSTALETTLISDAYTLKVTMPTTVYGNIKAAYEPQLSKLASLKKNPEYSWLPSGKRGWKKIVPKAIKSAYANSQGIYSLEERFIENVQTDITLHSTPDLKTLDAFFIADNGRTVPLVLEQNFDSSPIPISFVRLNASLQVAAQEVVTLRTFEGGEAMIDELGYPLGPLISDIESPSHQITVNDKGKADTLKEFNYSGYDVGLVEMRKKFSDVLEDPEQNALRDRHILGGFTEAALTTDNAMSLVTKDGGSIIFRIYPTSSEGPKTEVIVTKKITKPHPLLGGIGQPEIKKMAFAKTTFYEDKIVHQQWDDDGDPTRAAYLAVDDNTAMLQKYLSYGWVDVEDEEGNVEQHWGQLHEPLTIKNSYKKVTPLALAKLFMYNYTLIYQKTVTVAGEKEDPKPSSGAYLLVALLEHFKDH